MSKNTMGRRIVERREALGISQAELARRVGISPQAMQWIEAGKTLRPRFLTEIAQNLGVASEWLLFGNIVQAAPPKPAEPAALGYEIGLLERGWIEELEGAFPAPPPTPTGGTEIPVYVATAYPGGVERTPSSPALLRVALRELLPPSLEGNPSVDHSRDFPLLGLDYSSPDDSVVRPPSLSGSPRGYGLYFYEVAPLSPRIIGNELLYVDPNASPTSESIVIHWHRSNIFILSVFGSASDEWYSGSVSVKGTLTSVQISRQHIKETHVVTGLDFRSPTISRHKDVSPIPSSSADIDREIAALKARLAELVTHAAVLIDLDKLFRDHPSIFEHLSKKLDDTIK